MSDPAGDPEVQQADLQHGDRSYQAFCLANVLKHNVRGAQTQTVRCTSHLHAALSCNASTTVMRVHAGGCGSADR
jgi:hypothetical protein